MDFKWAEPPASNSVAFKLGLSALKSITRDVIKTMKVARRLSPLALAFLDRIQATSHQRPPAFGCFASLLQGNFRDRSKPHFASSSVDIHTQYPLRSAILTLVQPKPSTVRILARRRVLNRNSS